MPVSGLKTHDGASAKLRADWADARMVNSMRLVLAISALLAAVTEPSNMAEGGALVWLLFATYMAHSMCLYVLALRQQPVAQHENNLSRRRG